MTLTAAALVTAFAGPAAAAPPSTERTSVSSSEAQATGRSRLPDVSGTGRFVAFTSAASDLVAGDTNGFDDVFVRDLLTGTTKRVSVGAGGAQGNGASWEPSISAGGRFVAFTSSSSNLVAGDTNDAFDVFVRDLLTGVTVRASVATGGAQADGSSQAPSLAGRKVAFVSASTNLASGVPAGVNSVYVRDLLTGRTTLAGATATGAPADALAVRPVLAGDGRYVAFTTSATNLDAADTNFWPDVYRKDLLTGAVVRVSVTPGGAQADAPTDSASISATGRYVGFVSWATTLAGSTTARPAPGGPGYLYVRDLATGTLTKVGSSTPSAGTDFPFYRSALSATGRYVVFLTGAALDPADTNGQFDVYRRDLVTGASVLVSKSAGGALSDASSESVSISADGRVVAWASSATTLVPGDTNGEEDTFAGRP